MFLIKFIEKPSKSTKLSLKKYLKPKIIIINLYQNQKSYSSGFFFNQIDINSFNANATFMNNALQAANNDNPIVFENYTSLANNFQLIHKIFLTK